MSDGMSDAAHDNLLIKNLRKAALNLADEINACREGNRGWRPDIKTVIDNINDHLDMFGFTLVVYDGDKY